MKKLVPVERLASTPATALYLQPARQFGPDSQPDEEGADAIAQICQRLGGLPLATELAVARSRVLAL